MGGHNADYGGRECPLGARRVLVGSEMRAPAPLRRANVARGPPLPAPPRAPPPSAPRWGRVVSGLWAGLFYAGGPPFPSPPRPPPTICVRVCVWVSRCVGVGRCRCSGPLGRPPPSALWRGCRMPPDVPRPPPPAELYVRVWSRGAPSGPLGGQLARPL